MAPIICQVFGSDGLGITGMEVVLQCYVTPGKPEAQYVSYTGEEGDIDMWFCQDGNDEPELVEALDYTHYRMIFRTESFFGTGVLPWLDVRTDLYLIGKVQHTVRLQFGPDNLAYQVKHTSQPQMSWVRDCESVDWAGRRVDNPHHPGANREGACTSGSNSHDTQPLSPIYVDCDSSSGDDSDYYESSENLEDQSLLQKDKSFGKRKVSFNEGGMPPGKRARFNY